jgi:acyl-CoA reductase-like NAD-dependent aldehyde dehydrogenase
LRASRHCQSFADWRGGNRQIDHVAICQHIKKITLELGGNVWVNSFNILPPGTPFGGAKHSGFGQENSIYKLDAYSEVKSVHITL